MVLLKDLLDFGLRHFYPKFDIEENISKYKVWDEWLSSKYINGGWYFVDDVPEVVSIIHRDVGDIYLVDDDGLLHIAVELVNFSLSQSLRVFVEYGSNKHFDFSVSRYLNYNYSYTSLPSHISVEDLVKVTVSGVEVIENHLKYESVSDRVFTDVSVVSVDDFFNDIII